MMKNDDSFFFRNVISYFTFVLKMLPFACCSSSLLFHFHDEYQFRMVIIGFFLF